MKIQSFVLRAGISAVLLGSALACSSPAAKPTTVDRPDTWVEGREVGGGESASAPLDFSLSITKQLMSEEKPGENTFASPFSVMAALTLALNGAGGETYAEMAKLLGADGISTESWNKSMLALRKDLEGGADNRVTLSIANAMWLGKGESVGKLFIERNKEYLDAEVQTLDFASPAAVDAINDWVNEKTNERIPTIVNSLDPATVAVLANAIYFDAKWSSEFKPKDTHDATFTHADGSESQVKMLSQFGSEMYGEFDDYQALRKPYGKGRFAMTIVLPAEGKDASVITPLLESEAWKTLQDSLQQKSGSFEMPKLEIEWDKSLKQTLMSMGMTQAFGGADFSGIASNLFISDVLHKTFLKIDEEGTEAAAVTAIMLEKSAAPHRPDDPFSMICDRPYFIAITDTQTGAILFAGMINKP